jgi:phosphatidylinositol alpha-1,6-mannosyltransferase
MNVVRALPSIVKEFPGVVYHMVGIPSIEKEILATARQLNVEDHIKIHGMLDDFHKDQILSKSTIFIMLSNSLSNGDFEGFGIAILEANALGIPAIGSSKSGITDAISEGYTGFCIDPHDADALVIALKKILSSYVDFSKNAIEWAKKFEWDTIIPEYQKLLK